MADADTFRDITASVAEPFGFTDNTAQRPDNATGHIMRATILQKLITELLDFGLRDAAQPARAEKGLDVEPHMLFITVDRRGFEIFTPRALDPIIEIGRAHV